MSVLFSKNNNYLNTLFRKGGTGNVLFRKGIHTAERVGDVLTKAGNIGNKISPYLSGIPLGQASSIATGIGNSLTNLAQKGNTFRKSIEK